MSERKLTFFTSDWHIGHEKAIELDKRPFKDVEHMHRVLINNYNACVPVDGIGYFLGDIGMYNAEITKSVITQLNGKKVLVLGNHDKGMNSMYNCGFDTVVNSATLYIAKQRVTMTHCPLRGVFREDVSGMKGAMQGDHWHGERKNQAYSVEDEGQFHLSGHLHANNKRSKVILGRQMDVGVVGNKYRPVSVSEVESWINLTLPKVNDWREIQDYPDYKINYFGEIKTFKRYPLGRYLSFYKDQDGYLKTSLRNNDGNKGKFVHRLVAKAFIHNPHNLPQVNHRNGHKFDVAVANLEWSSNTDNQRHAWNTGLKVSKLTVENVKLIKSMLQEGKTNAEIATVFNVNPSTISVIKTGKCWRDV